MKVINKYVAAPNKYKSINSFRAKLFPHFAKFLFKLQKENSTGVLFFLNYDQMNIKKQKQNYTLSES